MTIAAKANYERVKMQTAQAMGDQQFNVQKQAQDEAYRRDALAQRQANDNEKIRVAEMEAALQHQVDMSQVVVDMAKAVTTPSPNGGNNDNSPPGGGSK